MNSSQQTFILSDTRPDKSFDGINQTLVAQQQIIGEGWLLSFSHSILEDEDLASLAKIMKVSPQMSEITLNYQQTRVFVRINFNPAYTQPNRRRHEMRRKISSL